MNLGWRSVGLLQDGAWRVDVRSMSSDTMDLAALDTEQHRRAVDRFRSLPDEVVVALQRLCRVATVALGSTESSVSVVSDAEYLLAHARDGEADGPEDPPERVPLHDSFCRYTVAGDRPFTVADARTDERTLLMPCVVSGESASYLGVPLRISGHAVGTLCVYGPELRVYGPEQVRLLTDLAASATSELALFEERRRLAEANANLAAALERAETAARTCGLTGLLNRVGLMDAIVPFVHDLARSGRSDTRGDTIQVAVLDLDGFKPVNDAYGHAAGDEVLRQIARRLEAAARSSDLVARIGGDEFVLVLAGGQDPTTERWAAIVEEPVRFDGVELRVGASVGIAFHCIDEPVDLPALIDRADQAMYAMKRTTGGTTARAHPAPSRASDRLVRTS
jgi:diguanylate cyclase (GGDEF)-like protein